MKQISSTLSTLCQQARIATGQLAIAPHQTRNLALHEIARALRQNTKALLEANEKDLSAANKKGDSDAVLDRMMLNAARIEAIAKGLEAIADLPDPLSGILEEWTRPNGLHIQKVPAPLGVIGVIYEARPNVTADAAGLSIKSGNAVLLRTGSGCFHSAQAIAHCITQGLKAAQLNEHAVQLIPSTNRDWVTAMLHAHGEIDVIIPRGGRSLTELVAKESRVPTLLHLDGNCHSYIHQVADLSMAVEVITNAKMRRTGVCGATESVLVDAAIAPQILPNLCRNLMQAGCKEIRGDAAAQAIEPSIIAADETDWSTEYLDAIISVKLVANVAEAIAHINAFGSHHTDAIFTTDNAIAQQFCAQVDSAIVMHNTSTQFADGGEFGMGAEIGIATGRLHARGPVGARQLTTYKYIVTSDGALRA